MLMDFNGSTLIEWVIRRTQKSKLIDNILVVIPNTKENDKLNDYIQSLGITVFRGSEDDVLGRFYESCVNHSVDTIVRICGDNPPVCPKELDRLIVFIYPMIVTMLITISQRIIDTPMVLELRYAPF